tara:strand:- start:11801 stop:12412 length:612 start_codon:yes stop_codon:yes gene_type:complete
MAVEMFNPRWYYRGDVKPEGQKQIKDLFERYLNDPRYFSKPESWECTCSSSWERPENEELPWIQWLEVLKPHLNEFVEEMKPKTDIQIIPQQAWANHYDTGHYQEYHKHSGVSTNISVVYFYDIPEDDCGFRFNNDEFYEYDGSGLDSLFELPVGFYVTPKDIKTGSVVMFPSHYAHSVVPNRSNKRRTTMSANIFIIPQNPA